MVASLVSAQNSHWPRSLPLKAAWLRSCVRQVTSPKPRLAPCPAKGCTRWAASLHKQSRPHFSKILSTWPVHWSVKVWLSYPIRATRCLTYSDAWPIPKGNMTRDFGPIAATLGGSCRGDPVDGMMTDRALRNSEPAVSTSSDWFSLLHF